MDRDDLGHKEHKKTQKKVEENKLQKRYTIDSAFHSSRNIWNALDEKTVEAHIMNFIESQARQM